MSHASRNAARFFRLVPAIPACFLACLLVCFPPSPAMAAKAASAAPALSPFLPASFAGWQLSGTVHESGDPQAADAANAGVLQEYGFQQFSSASYANGGNTLKIRAIRFANASGAYGAFTFYRRANTRVEEIGRGAAWDGSHALFWTGAVLVDATFGQLTAMSAAELRELAGDLPKPPGADNIAPSLPAYLPKKDLDAASVRYAIGPLSYVRTGGVLPPVLADFSGGDAEAVTATYTTRDGQEQLTLLDYPTPQLAAQRFSAIDGYLKNSAGRAEWPQPLAESRPESLLIRRSGPIVVVASGSLPAGAARALINQVNYEAAVTWNHTQGYVSESSKAARLLLGVAALIGIIAGAAILLGLFLGGGRALIRKLQGKPVSALDEETEFIRLNLK